MEDSYLFLKKFENYFKNWFLKVSCKNKLIYVDFSFKK